MICSLLLQAGICFYGGTGAKTWRGVEELKAKREYRSQESGVILLTKRFSGERV
jgi:hypothetical protein